MKELVSRCFLGQEFNNCFIFISTYVTVIYVMTEPPVYCSNEKAKQFNVQMFLARYSSQRGREILNAIVQGRAETSPVMLLTILVAQI